MIVSSDIDAHRLTRTAFAILVADLESHGNVLSQWHRAALMELVDTLTGYCTGVERGRRAFPLPTGMGKTSAVVAFLAALHRLDCLVPVSVAASKVEALCNMKRELVAHGVPLELIGLKHAVLGASEESTGTESRLFQLVTHARVRSGRDFDLFGEHGGHPRALCIYDETFMRADAFAFRARSLYSGVAVLEVEAEGNSNPLVGQLVVYVQEAVALIKSKLLELQQQGDPYSNGAAVTLAPLEPGTVDAFQDLVGRFGAPLKGFESELRDLLTQSQHMLRVVGTEQGDGVVTAREVVPLTLKNVVVLDASAPIRELARLDPTVTVVDHFGAIGLKDFAKVEVMQLVSPGGRTAIGKSLGSDRKEASAVALEVARIIRDGWETEKAFLIFTFVRRAGADLVGELKKDLQRAGIDIEAKTAEGHQRVNWLTWGSETNLNGLEHCTSVIMAGVLHRSHPDLSAMIRGQTGNPAEPTPNARIREVIESEIAHCIYQGASRGSCRRIMDGKAQPMRLWFIHKNPAIKTILDRVMPGAIWSYPEPKYLKKATADSKAAQLLGQLLGYLRDLPDSIDKISSRKAKDALGLTKDKATELAFTRAVGLLDLADHGWQLDGRSLGREGAILGFVDQT